MNAIIGVVCGSLVGKGICYLNNISDPISVVIQGTYGTLIVLGFGIIGGVMSYYIW
jgi:hypothetical protein